MRLKKKIYTDKLEFEYFVNISKEGLFTAYLPEEIITKLESSGIKIGHGRGGRKGYFEAQSLKEIEENISKIIQKFSEKKLVSSKIVLRYEIITACAYGKTEKGEIVPNGYWQKRIDKTDKYEWLGGTKQLNSNDSEPFGFQIYVEPQRLNVYIFPDKTEHKEYVNIEDEDIKEGSTLDWLNSICGMRSQEDDNIKDIDYSEEIGLFFKNVILYICNLNENLKKVFGEEMEINPQKLLNFNSLH